MDKLYLFPPLLALVAQYLTVPEKVCVLPRLAKQWRATRALPAAAFVHDSLCLNLPPLPTAYASSLPLVARLMPRLAFRYTTPLRGTSDDELLMPLYPPQPVGQQQLGSVQTATFPYLKALSLTIPHPREKRDDAALHLPFHWANSGVEKQPCSFPRLACLRLALGSNGIKWADPLNLHSLQLLPRLRSVQLEGVPFSLPTLQLLLALPLLEHLDVEQCWLYHGATHHPRSGASFPRWPSWRTLRLPLTSGGDWVMEELLQHLVRVQSGELAEVQCSPARLQHLEYRSQPSVLAMQQVTRLSSLTHLELLTAQTFPEGRSIDLSPLWTSASLPSLPALVSWVSPRSSNRPWSSDDLHRLLHDSVKLLSVYSAQLLRLDVTVLSAEELPLLLQAASCCARLERLAVVWQSGDSQPLRSVWGGAEEKAEHLQTWRFRSVRHLRLHRVPLSLHALQQLLLHGCPALESCLLQAVPISGLSDALQSEAALRFCPQLSLVRSHPCDTFVPELFHAGQRLEYRCYCHRVDNPGDWQRQVTGEMDSAQS